MADFDPDVYLKKKQAFDPDAYLKNKGVVLKQPPPAQSPGQSWGQNVTDALKSIPPGYEKGVVGAITAIPTLAQMGQGLAEKGFEHFWPGITKTVQDISGPAGGIFNPKYAYPAVQQKVENAATAVGTPIHQPQT